MGEAWPPLSQDRQAQDLILASWQDPHGSQSEAASESHLPGINMAIHVLCHPASPLLGPDKDLYMNVHNYFIHNSSKLEIT